MSHSTNHPNNLRSSLQRLAATELPQPEALDRLPHSLLRSDGAAHKLNMNIIHFGFNLPPGPPPLQQPYRAT
jgi:hypothetical protein